MVRAKGHRKKGGRTYVHERHTNDSVPIVGSDVAIKEEHLVSVRETEALVRKSKAPKQSSETPYQPAYIQQAADDLEKLFDTAVSVNANSLGRGQLKISFESQEKLQNILNKIKGEA